MTNEEAIGHIKDVICENNTIKPNIVVFEQEKEALYMAIKALEKLPKRRTEAKTVLYSGDGYADGYMVYDMAECPNCGYEYEESDKDWGLSFCPNCGQSLIWESEDEEQE